MVLIVTLLEKILVVEHLEQENEYFANRKAIEIDFFTLDLFENADEASKSQGKASFSVVQHHRGVVLRLEEVPPTTTRPKCRRAGPAGSTTSSKLHKFDWKKLPPRRWRFLPS